MRQVPVVVENVAGTKNFDAAAQRTVTARAPLFWAFSCCPCPGVHVSPGHRVGAQPVTPPAAVASVGARIPHLQEQTVSHPSRRPLAVVTWSIIAVLAAGCSLFRGPVTAPADPPPPATTPAPPPPPAPAPTLPPPPAPPVDVEALIVAAAAEQTGYPESLIRAFLAARGIDVEQVVANLGVPADQVDDILAEMKARGVDTIPELQAFLTELQARVP